MKRSYAEMSTSLLPVLSQEDPRRFKMVLEGLYKLRTVRVSDISKPSSRPVADIDEPENEDDANESKLNQNNARMIQLSLKDTNNTEICALEKERIPELDDVQINWYVFIEGPVEVRCGNIMLEKKHVTGKVKLSDAEISQVSTQPTIPSPVRRPPAQQTPTQNVGSSDDEPTSAVKRPSTGEPTCVNLVDVAEDWDDDDDCIIIE